MIIWTYASHNAPENYRWLAFIKDDLSADPWPIRFRGSTRDEVELKAREFYEIDREKREAAIAARKAAAEKRRKTN